MTDSGDSGQAVNPRRGPFKRLVAYVWRCGDDWCGCSQACIDAQYANASDQRFIWSERLWEGEFYTDHEPGAQDELDAIETAMRDAWPEVAAQLFGSYPGGPDVAE